MSVAIRSFAKINLGLYIGAPRPDGFHELRTVYQTIALHDVIGVQIVRGTGIEIRCADARVPKDASNTCYRIAERTTAALRVKGRVVIEIEKRLPVQGGLGGASGNAVATMLAVERAVNKTLSGAERLQIAAEVGSDLPLFLVGGTVLGVGRGEEVYPLPDLPAMACVIATPEIGVSTPQAFADWDAMRALICHAELASAGEESAVRRQKTDSSGLKSLGMTTTNKKLNKLTSSAPSDRMMELGRLISAWLSGAPQISKAGRAASGVPVSKGRVRAEIPLLDLVRTGIENDFEKVVFPKYPELREAKRVLERAGAMYASLSGSGSALYGLFASKALAEKAAGRLRKRGTAAVATTTLTRRQYWKSSF